MNLSRLPIKVHKWGRELEHQGLGFQSKIGECMGISNICVLNVLQARLLRQKCDLWWLGATTKLKLRTFLQIYDRK